MMSTQHKLVIITSDEDLIRQIYTSKNTNTQIIDLNNDQQLTSIARDDNNNIDLPFLTQLSELNSKRDQVYKRALDSPHDDQSKPIKLSKKSVDLICAVCGDQAIGYNYDVLSCASCKAFFLRNANQNSRKIRCLTGQGQCSVAHEVHRKCPRCRLDRCLAVGMRKDFLLSEEVKQRRKKPVKENRNTSSKRSSQVESTNSSSTAQPLSNLESLSETLDEIDCLLMDIDEVDDNVLIDENLHLNGMDDILLGTLSVEEWITIQNIRSSFLSMFENNNTRCFSVDVSDRASALISWSHFVNKVALGFINFFRQIDEFESLNADDRFTLVKYNMSPILPIFKCFMYKSENDCCSYDDNEVAVKHRLFFTLCGDTTGIREAFINTVALLVELTGQDPTLLSLLSSIFVFTHGLSMNEEELLLKDSLAVHRAQGYYTKLLWNYLVSKQGEVQACKYFIKLLRTIFQVQSTCKRFQGFFRTQIMSSDTADRIAPVTQSVLLVS